MVTFEYDGGSFGLGFLCAAVILGHISPWFLLLAPLFLFRYPPWSFSIKRTF